MSACLEAEVAAEVVAEAGGRQHGTFKEDYNT